MKDWLKEHKGEFLEALKIGKYKPQPVRRVEIPKPDGGKRKLGIPTVLDRLVQQAIAQVLQPIFEKIFSENSYGFRPGRNAHQAIKQAEAYYEEGYTKIVDLDLAQYFDTVNHDILINMLREEIQDERVISLIRKYLKSGVMEGGIVSPTSAGTPQGGLCKASHNPPCGVPLSVSSIFPCSMTPALKNRTISRSRFGSWIRSCRNFFIHP
ncbi:reverse transcriptase domain-containing protein [Sporomusa silvacetica]